ncbi:MAG: peptide chain release factor N(5)-glutamine methyltransferase [Atribacterota bacterium]
MMSETKDEFKTIGQALRYINKLLENAKIINSSGEAEILLSYLLKMNRSEIYLNFDKILSNNEKRELEQAIQKRLKNIPLQYITKHQEFMGMDFFIEEGVLIPRPETEILVEKIIEKLKNKKPDSPLRVVDLGTGSGIIAISIAKYIKDITIYATDISEKTLKLAFKNAHKHNCEDRIIFLQGDLFEPLREKIDQNSLDGIVSNPPYISLEDFKSLPIEIKEKEPKIALYGGINGIDYYRKIIKKASYFLKKNGFLALEVGAGQAKKVKELILKEHNFKQNIEIFKDYSNIERVVITYRK